MAKTSKYIGVTSGVWDIGTNWDPAPVNGDSATFYGADLGAGTKLSVGPTIGTPITLVAVSGNVAYGEGTICYQYMTVTTLSCNGQGAAAMTGGTVTTAALVDSSVTGGTITTSVSMGDGSYINVGAGATVDLSGCTVTANADGTFSGITMDGGTLTTSATTVFDIGTATGGLEITGATFSGTLQATAAGAITLAASAFSGKVNCASAVDWLASTASSITLNATNATTRFGGALPAGTPVTINGAGANITAAEAFDMGGVFTVTQAGTVAMAAYGHTFRKGFVHTAGTITGTGIWNLAGTGSLKLTSTGVKLHVTAGTLTQTGTVSVDSIRMDPGTTLDGARNDMVLNGTTARITGYGAVKNLVPTGAVVHCGPDIINGGGNSATKVVFDSPRNPPGLIEL